MYQVRIAGGWLYRMRRVVATLLIAILAGNIIYLFIEPRLPSIFQHRLFRVDLGLGVDFLICAAAYGLVHQLRPHREDPGGD